MSEIKKLPDAEFDIMRVIWANESPISTAQIISKLEDTKKRKPQTILTLLVRLIERGFLKSDKIGKERTYCPIISEQDYLQYETGNFIERFYQSSLTNLVVTLFDGGKITESDIDDLTNWLKQRG